MISTTNQRRLRLHPWPLGLALGMLCVISFNIWLATVAVRRYGEPVTDQPYLDSLQHQHLIEAQRALLEAGVSAQLHVASSHEVGKFDVFLEAKRADGTSVDLTAVRGKLVHLSGEESPIAADWHSDGSGLHVSPKGLGPGLWLAEIWFDLAGQQYAHTQKLKIP